MNRTRIAPRDSDCVQRIAATCGESPMWSAAEEVLYWTDNLGGRIHRLEPETGNAESFEHGQDAMAIGLREGGGSCSRSRSSSPSTSPEASPTRSWTSSRTNRATASTTARSTVTGATGRER
jgi:sugar lactone lactonase YvrE